MNIYVDGRFTLLQVTDLIYLLKFTYEFCLKLNIFKITKPFIIVLY